MATTDKYDRQLRLWGASGQRALSESTVVLIRATACGTETLKNLVLPGIGHMIIVDDDDTCQQQQYASNFFLTYSSNTTSRAEQALEHLQELNPDVQGSFRHVESVLDYDWEQLWKHNHNLPHNNWIFILADPEPPLLKKLSKFCQMHSIPLIVVTSYGLIGMVQLQITPAFPLIDPKPRDSIPDLRLVHPFPQLVEFAESIMHHGGEQQKSHIPYPILLLHVQKQWKEQHDGNLPSTFSEKQAFQQAIKQLVVAPQSYDQYLNVQEAVQWAYTAYSPRTLPIEKYQQLLQTYNKTVFETDTISASTTTTTDVSTTDTTITTTTTTNTTRASISQFMILLRALFQFLEQNDQQPPLSSTSIPDMHASTALYIGLQTIYRTRALEDWKEFSRYVRKLETQTQSKNPVPEEIIETFCQNIFSLDVLDTGTIHEVYKQLPVDGNASTTTTFDDKATISETVTTTTNLMEALQDDSEGERPEQSPLLWYLGYRACQMFYDHCGRFPGTTTSESYSEDVDPVHHYLLQLLQQYQLAEHPILSNISTKDIAIEMVRYGNAEIHTIASIVGGVASQEAVKIITGQYVPINNTYVYNGIASIGGVYRM